MPASLREAAEAAEGQDRGAVLVGWDGQARAALVIADQLKPHAGATVARIRGLGLRPRLLTGDNPRAALAVAGRSASQPPMSPPGCGPRARSRPSAGCRQTVAVALVGDGVNDAAALAQADLGMAIGANWGGTDAAIGAADLTLVSSNQLSIVYAIELGPRHYDRDPRQPHLGLATGIGITERAAWRWFATCTASPTRTCGAIQRDDGIPFCAVLPVRRLGARGRHDWLRAVGTQ